MSSIRMLMVAILLAVFISPVASYAQPDEAIMLAQARKHYQERNYYFSSTWLERVLKTYPQTPQREEVLLMLAKSYAETERNERAVRAVQTLLKDYPKSVATLEPGILKLAGIAPPPGSGSPGASVPAASLIIPVAPPVPVTATPPAAVGITPKTAVTTAVMQSSTEDTPSIPALKQNNHLSDPSTVASVPPVPRPVSVEPKSSPLPIPAPQRNFVNRTRTQADNVPAKIEAAKIEAAKIEAAKIEAAKVEAAKVEAAKVEAAKVEAAKVEAAKVEAARVEAARVKPPKAEPPKMLSPKVEQPKPEQHKVASAHSESLPKPAPAKAVRAAAAAVVLTGARPVPLNAEGAEQSRKSDKTGQAVTYTLVLGEYVVKTALQDAKMRAQKAGVQPVVEQGPKRKEPMTRIYIGGFAKPEAVKDMAEKLRSADAESFTLKDKTGKLHIYAGSYHDQKAAEKEKVRLAALGIKSDLKQVLVSVPTFVLTAGCFYTQEAAMEKVAELEQLGMKSVVVRKSP